MRALLQYGQFSTLIHIPGDGPRPMVSVMKPQHEISFIPLEDQDRTPNQWSEEKYRLDFRLKERLNDDIWLYEFYGEA